MMKYALMLLISLCAIQAEAQLQVATREGVTVPIYAHWRDDAKVNVVLFSGGGGGYGDIGADGWPTSGNFLIRTGRHWASRPVNLIMVGRPSDKLDLSNGRVRGGDLHHADNTAIFREIKRRSPLPIWLVGTSMGSISAASEAARDSEKLVSGLVLSSSVTAYAANGVLTLPLQQILVPTLVLHHKKDACQICPPHEAARIAEALENAPMRKTVFVDGGGEPKGPPCQAFHYHGFINMEQEAVDLIADWILAPSP